MVLIVIMHISGSDVKTSEHNGTASDVNGVSDLPSPSAVESPPYDASRESMIQLESLLDRRRSSGCDKFNAVFLKEYVKQFQETVDKAHLVVAVLSEAFIKARSCKQQVNNTKNILQEFYPTHEWTNNTSNTSSPSSAIFSMILNNIIYLIDDTIWQHYLFCDFPQIYYCEHRKQILPVRFDNMKFPYWLSMLIQTQRVVDARAKSFHNTFMMQVQRLLDPTAKNCLAPERHEANINVAVCTSCHCLCGIVIEILKLIRLADLVS